MYDAQGRLLTTTMMDYLVPMAAEVPDIWVGHTGDAHLLLRSGGFKGAGEAGVSGAPGAMLNAVGDALAPLGARVSHRVHQLRSRVVLRALGTHS